MNNRLKVALSLLFTAPAFGQATLYMTSFGTDITPDGNTITGTLYDASADEYWAHVLNRATGVHTYYTDRGVEGGAVYCNGDGTVLAAEMHDFEDLAGFGSERTISHGRFAGGPWTNLGLPWNGYRCDYVDNSPYGVARNTNEILLNGWSRGLCGPFRAWLYDSTTSSFTQLPYSVSPPPFNAPSFHCKAYRISDNADAACGWDNNWNAAFTQHFRKAAAWKKVGGVWQQTILDPNGGDALAVSGDGNSVVGFMNSVTMQQVFGTTAQTAVLWQWNGSTWVPRNLGGASSGASAYWISTDGNTVVGDYFIWRPNLNGGVAMNLGTFLSQQGLNTYGIGIGGPAGAITQGLSGDGNSLIVQLTDSRNPCLTVFKRGIIDFNGRPCSPPIELFPPVSQNVEGEIGQPGNHYYGVILNVFSAGSADVTYQWQKQVDGAWTDLTDDNCDQFTPHLFDVKGARGSQLRLGDLSGPGAFVGSYRCLLTNSCGAIESTTAVIRMNVPCPADFNGDGFLDFFDYDDFVACFESGVCPPGKTADYNGDSFADFFDYDDFVNGFETGC